MRIGILSDTHNEIERTRRAIELLRAEGAETLIHCGDLAEPPMVAVCSSLPCYFVFGNHDADMTPHLEQAARETGAVCLGWGGVIELGGKRIGVVHGHLTFDLRRVLADSPDYLLTGHSHAPSDRREGLMRRINPGAVHRADPFTVAVLDLDTDEVRFLVVPERA